MTERLKRIAIDLTPIIPGGENGGAKVFILELIHQLAQDHPDTQWLLLIHARAEEELKSLKKANVDLILALEQDDAPARQPLTYRAAKKLLALLPDRIGSQARRVIHRTSRYLRKGKPSRYRGGTSLLKGLGTDLLFCPFTAPNFRDPTIPLVSTIHDLQYKTYPQFFEANDVAHRDRIFLEAARNSTLLTAVSDYARNSAILHGRFEADRIRTILHRLALRVDSPESNQNNALQKWGLTAGQFLIYPANFWRHKNHEMLLTGFAMAIHDGLPKNIQLVLTGAPTERQALLIEATHTMGLKDRVIFPGYVSNQELGSLLKASIGMIFPSLYEGFGMPVIEAMAMGVPVASSKSASLAEISGDAALLFDARKPREIRKSIQTLVTDTSLREGLIQKGLERANIFSDTPRMAEEYWDTFKSALILHGAEHRITGVYHDGWLGTALSIEVGRLDQSSHLEVTVSSPDWIPYKRNRIDIDINGLVSESVRISRGTSKTIRIPLQMRASIIELFIAPAFDSSQFNQGDDARPLTIKLDACRLMCEDGSNQALYPPENT